MREVGGGYLWKRWNYREDKVYLDKRRDKLFICRLLNDKEDNV